MPKGGGGGREERVPKRSLLSKIVGRPLGSGIQIWEWGPQVILDQNNEEGGGQNILKIGKILRQTLKPRSSNFSVWGRGEGGKERLSK